MELIYFYCFLSGPKSIFYANILKHYLSRHTKKKSVDFHVFDNGNLYIFMLQNKMILYYFSEHLQYSVIVVMDSKPRSSV